MHPSSHQEFLEGISGMSAEECVATKTATTYEEFARTPPPPNPGEGLLLMTATQETQGVRMEAGADHESDYFGSKACHGDHGRWCTPRAHFPTETLVGFAYL